MRSAEVTVSGNLAKRPGDERFPRWRRSVAVIAVAAGMASFAMNFWVPFLPVYMKQLGAESDAAALAWIGAAYTGTGIGRLVGGPFWGVLSDRYGRKRMFVRALLAATLTTLIAAGAQAPWHFVVAWTSQGLLSGFIPAAVALTSVSVPRTRLTTALGSVQGAQYTGNTIGPLIGAGLAALFGLRGAVLAGALVPTAAALMVVLVVPRDRAGALPAADPAPGGRLTALTGGLSMQLGLGLLLFFTIHMTGGLVRTAAPVALERLSHRAATDLAGLTFAAGGLASALGAVGLARLFRPPASIRTPLVAVLLAAAAAHGLLGLADSATLFIVAFALTGLCQGAMLPATNTVIAAAVPYERRGAAFGLASSVQALAFVAGPLGAAYFAGVSLAVGFLALGGMLALVGAVTALALREPAVVDEGAPHRVDRAASTQPGR
jgi:DHA1 family multidrug resistance protein-like MFS transporter